MKQIEQQITSRIDELRAWFAELAELEQRKDANARELAKLEAAANALGLDVRPRKRASPGVALAMVSAWVLRNCGPDWRLPHEERFAIARLIRSLGTTNPGERLPDVETIVRELDNLNRNWPPIAGSTMHAEWDRAPKKESEPSAAAIPSA